MEGKKSFKDLTDSDKEYIALVYSKDRDDGSKLDHQEKIRILTDKYKVVGRTIRRWWSRLGITKNSTDLPPQLARARQRLLEGDEEVLIVTSAQNKSLVHEEAWGNILTYKNFIQEELGKKSKVVVIPARYRNPITLDTIERYKKHEWWAPEVDENLYYYQVEFADVLIGADIRVVPTAKNPLSGFEPLAGEGHFILGHPRPQFKTLARFKGDSIKTMSTSGYITRPRYTVSKAGATSGKHHSYGFVICEKNSEDTCFVPRKIKINQDGSFTDVVWSVSENTVSRVEESDGVVLGDIHNKVIDVEKDKASMNLIRSVNPGKVILHDLFDGYTVNPHEKKDLFIQRRKIVEGDYLVHEEVEEAVKYPQKFVDEGYEVCVIQSNHDQFLDRFINDKDWRKDLHNSVAYLEYAKIQQQVDLRKYGNIFGYLLSERYGEGVQYIKYSDPLRINGYLNFHGEFGSNGSRGSPTTFRKLNTKIVHAHTHSPYMLDNVVCVGTSSLLWQYYNSRGPSSWAHADLIFHKSGKNQLIVYNNDYEFSNLMDA